MRDKQQVAVTGGVIFGPLQKTTHVGPLPLLLRDRYNYEGGAPCPKGHCTVQCYSCPPNKEAETLVPKIRAGNVLGFYNYCLVFLFFKCFFRFLRFVGFNSGHKITTHKQRFGHVNATNHSSYLNIICIKLVTQVK